MNIAILPSAYPNIYNDHSSIFVQDQVDALSKYSDFNICVIGAIPISLKDVWKAKLFKFGYYKAFNNGVKTTLFLFPSIPKMRFVNNYVRHFLNKSMFKRYIKEQGKPSVIHVHNAIAGKTALWIKKQYNVSYCITEHSSAYARKMYKGYELKLFKEVYANSTYNIAVSKEFCHLLNKMTNEQFNYLPNIINSDFFVPLEYKRSSKEFRFINIGYLNKNKNQLELIRAFSKLFKGKKNIKLSILGNGPEYDALRREIDGMHLQNQITLYGFASRDEALKELQNSDAFVLSSKYETFGVVIIEAMSCGLPVVSTKCGGPESIIINNQLGILVGNSIDELAKGMKKVYEKEYDKKVIRNYIVENYSEKIIAEKIIKIYKMIINEKN